jgi:hypothetical protein
MIRNRRNSHSLVILARSVENPVRGAYYLVILGQPLLSSLAERSEAEDPANRATRDFATVDRRAVPPSVT